MTRIWKIPSALVGCLVVWLCQGGLSRAQDAARPPTSDEAPLVLWSDKPPSKVSVMPAAYSPPGQPTVLPSPVAEIGKPQPQSDFFPAIREPEEPGQPPPVGKCLGSDPAVFTPYMLGDLGQVINNPASDAKIAEGESPRPLDRVFYKFNYFHNLEPSHFSRDFTEPIHNVDLFRNVFGFEKTFLDGRMSVGLRVPVNTFDADPKEFVVMPAGTRTVVGPGGPSIHDTEFGDLSVIIKAIVCEDCATGSLVSAGAVVSFPTADFNRFDPGYSTRLLFQPFAGFILNRGDWFFQGFTSVTLPVTSTQEVVWFNDLGVGYYVYRNAAGSGWLAAVAPTLEMHVSTPLRRVESDSDIDRRLNDVVDFTLGTTFLFTHRTTLGVGLVAPVTGPRPFDVEALAQLNYRF
jgi:hypothetical protein